MLWTIPCKWGGHDHLTGLIESIRLHQPDDQILVVDSCSDDQSYLDTVDADHIRTGNPNYGTGAWRFAAEIGADQYALVHDSMRVNAPLPDTSPLTTLQWFSSQWGSEELTAYGRGLLKSWGIPEEPGWRGVVGPVMWVGADVFDALGQVGVLDARPGSKEQASAMERVVGIVLGHLGYDVTRSLQGEHSGQHDQYDDSVVFKRFAGRL